MKRLARLLAGLAIFGFFVIAAGRAADAEFASAGGVLPGSVLTEREVAALRGRPGREHGTAEIPIGRGSFRRVPAPPGAPTDSACGASSIGPDGRVTVTSCGERLSEREVSPRSSHGMARANAVVDSRSENLYQGKPVRWWARRAVQARKDANARGRTIRRLQTTARRQLAYPTGHWLDGAFLCIHRYERGAAGWATNTGNGYRGGLQFDSSFARTYGPSWAFRAFGGVERWPASVQITAAIQAWTTRGFGPWPSTRRMCGL